MLWFIRGPVDFDSGVIFVLHVPNSVSTVCSSVRKRRRIRVQSRSASGPGSDPRVWKEGFVWHMPRCWNRTPREITAWRITSREAPNVTADLQYTVNEDMVTKCTILARDNYSPDWDVHEGYVCVTIILIVLVKYTLWMICGVQGRLMEWHLQCFHHDWRCS